ncbi:CHAT domain-containing protein [Tengunoibacter tsumagoiensis]|uniref:CHAT domain-containing protein n=1 Tax=Tengunoibacter tsumagoiensis TaxID=2014871 RepID=A0A401ZZP8_9CHLR|nr:CHAT domain-containing tetratricopeptide repeat protein [Tengunoibacter tsumagoiensis]GCE12350.1 hypothetical protein KTT_22090 [Tengunoibacter tsumagoiensis]
MTPQELLAELVGANEEQGRRLLVKYVPQLSEVAQARLGSSIKREADRLWNTEERRSFILAGYLMTLGELTQQRVYQAWGLMARGDALRRMDRDQEALPFLDAAGEEFLALQDEVGWARTRIGRINACLRLNRTTEALRDARQAREVFLRHGKLQRVGQVDVSAAIIYFELGQYVRALHLFDRAIEAYSMHGERVDLHIARARGNKALVLAAMGRFHEAAALHQQACETFRLYGEREEISVAREELNIADGAVAQGHYSQALQLYRHSRALFYKHAMPEAAAEVAQQICICLLRLNRLKEASEIAQEIVQFFRTQPEQRHNLARSLMLQADITARKQSFDGAADMLDEAIVLLEEGGFGRLALLARLRRAELRFSCLLLEQSEQEADYVAEVFAERGDSPYLARALLLQARIAEARQRPLIALDLCHLALDIAKGQDLLDLTYCCEMLLGQIVEQQGDLVEAEAAYERAIQCIDKVQSRLILDERTSFLEDKGGIYQRAILLALRNEKISLAFTYVEKAKSRVLGDYLRNNIDIRLRTDGATSEPLLEDLARLRAEQAWFSSIVYQTEDEAALSDTALMRRQAMGPLKARHELQQREQKIEQLVIQLQKPASGSITVSPDLFWLKLPQSILAQELTADTLLLEYYLSGTDIYIFQMYQGQTRITTVPDSVPQLERLLSLWSTNLELATQLLGDSDQMQSFPPVMENAQGLLFHLYQLLMEPVASALEQSGKVIIVPYGMLHYLPFHCLFDGKHFLIEQKECSYLPAAALLDICRQRGERVRVSADELQRSLVVGFSQGGRLPHVLQEAQVVSQLLGAHCALNEQATADLLWKEAAQSPLVHIAAHGQFRLDAPNFSSIKLADRALSTIDVFNLTLSACSLVVLSACETGRAVIGGVDEVMGLGRGFLYAGAASLLSTLWKVEDASTAELMEMFYRAILAGKSKATALAEAQRQFIVNARQSGWPSRCHPYFWAAFQLIGDVGPVRKGDC